MHSHRHTQSRRVVFHSCLHAQVGFVAHSCALPCVISIVFFLLYDLSYCGAVYIYSPVSEQVGRSCMAMNNCTTVDCMRALSDDAAVNCTFTNLMLEGALRLSRPGNGLIINQASLHYKRDVCADLAGWTDRRRQQLPLRSFHTLLESWS